MAKSFRNTATEDRLLIMEQCGQEFEDCSSDAMFSNTGYEEVFHSGIAYGCGYFGKEIEGAWCLHWALSSDPDDGVCCGVKSDCCELNMGLVAGLAAGGIVVLGVIIAASIMCAKKKNSQQQNRNELPPVVAQAPIVESNTYTQPSSSSMYTASKNKETSIRDNTIVRYSAATSTEEGLDRKVQQPKKIKGKKHTKKIQRNGEASATSKRKKKKKKKVLPSLEAAVPSSIRSSNNNDAVEIDMVLESDGSVVIEKKTPLANGSMRVERIMYDDKESAWLDGYELY